MKAETEAVRCVQPGELPLVRLLVVLRAQQGLMAGQRGRLPLASGPLPPACLLLLERAAPVWDPGGTSCAWL